MTINFTKKAPIWCFFGGFLNTSYSSQLSFYFIKSSKVLLSIYSVITLSNPFQNEYVLQPCFLEQFPSSVKQYIGDKSPSVALKISPTIYSFGSLAKPISS